MPRCVDEVVVRPLAMFEHRGSLPHGRQRPNARRLPWGLLLCEHPGVSSKHRPDDRPFAVVDVGSNSARMIVFRLSEGEHLDVIEDARAPLRLARELRDGNELGEEAIDRTLEALRDFRAIADGAGADRMIAVATSAL